MAYKVYARKQKYSIITISQSYFESGKYAKVIRFDIVKVLSLIYLLRNNVMLVVTFECFGNIDENARIARQIGFSKQFKVGPSFNLTY